MMKEQNKTKQITTALFLTAGLAFSNTATAGISEIWESVREFGKKIPNVFEGVSHTFRNYSDKRCSITITYLDYRAGKDRDKSHTTQFETERGFKHACNKADTKIGEKVVKWLNNNQNNLALENHLLKCKRAGLSGAQGKGLDGGIYTTCPEKNQIVVMDLILEAHRSKFTHKASSTAVPLDQQATDWQRVPTEKVLD